MEQVNRIVRERPWVNVSIQINETVINKFEADVTFDGRLGWLLGWAVRLELEDYYE
jgi:hypothetical protein